MRTRRIRIAGLPLPLAFALVLVLVPWGAPACGRDERPPPVLLIGVDGLEWSVVLPLLRQGRLPHLAALMERGTYGLLETIEPTVSPVVWTTIATGKTRDEHGIRGFSKPYKKGRPRELYSNRDRKTKAIWNVAGEHGRSVAIVGWWMTHPVEPVNGVMVAQTNTVEQLAQAKGKQVWKGTLRDDVEGQVHPPERTAEMLSILQQVEQGLEAELLAIFGEFEHPFSLLSRRLFDNCRWSFRADATYVGIAEKLLAEDARHDLTAVYLGGPDVVGHRFWRYREPTRYAHPPGVAEIENFGGLIDDYYVYVDAAIGRLVAAAGPETNVLVVSDHGMHPVNLAARFDPDDPPVDVNSASHLDAPPGVLIAAGPSLARLEPRSFANLRRSELERSASVVDLARCVLALLALPAGADMHGSVPAQLFDAEFLRRHRPGEVPSHDTQAWLRAHAALEARPGDAQAERLRQLEDLGYIGAEGDVHEGGPEPPGSPELPGDEDGP